MDHLVARRRRRHIKETDTKEGIRRFPPRRGRGGDLWLVRAVALSILFILLGCMVHQYIGVQLDNWRYPPRGERINIRGGQGEKGHYLHLRCLGSGPSAVILEAGLPFSSLSFELVLEEAERSGLTKNLAFCAYDRSGYGWSDLGRNPRNVAIIAEELHSLLTVANVPSPRLIVGWSFGGWIAEVYATKFPAHVRGLVLVDSIVANQTQRVDGFVESLNEGLFAFNVARMTVTLGLFRLAGPFDLLPTEAGDPPSSTPTQLRNENRATVYKYNFPEVAYQELSAFRESEIIINELYRSKKVTHGNEKETLLGDLPVAVLTAVNSQKERSPAEVAWEKEWIQIQKLEAEALTSNSRQWLVECSHYIPYDCASSLVNAIKFVIQNPSLKFEPGRNAQNNHLF
jgi:pimeloyl-ACP methyl ester carboxylesterase